MPPQHQNVLCWFRRDLRTYDHAALYHALKSSEHVFCAFVFDHDLLDELPDRVDRRVDFIWHSVRELQLALEKLGGGLIIRHGSATAEIPALAQELGVSALYYNHDYEPDALARDDLVRQQLLAHDITCFSFKDQVIFEKNEILAQNGRPYHVFTPYKNSWLKSLGPFFIKSYQVEQYAAALAPQSSSLPMLEELGFQASTLKLPPGMSGARTLLNNFRLRIAQYHEWRDFPAMKGPSYLSVHLRFGTISIRELVRLALGVTGPGARTWLNELIWREFYQMLLYHHPRVTHQSFKQQYDAITWPGPDGHFAAWCAGQTGYPLVDAAMRQLNQSGYMHNRLRMVAASFLVKDLQIDWRKGERYFARKLIDYDLAANNGGWQWAASTGCDAQPWFRIFNPVTQSEKFDPEGKFIRRYVPELTNCETRFIHAPWKMPEMQQRSTGIIIGKDYPAPLVDHATAREITLALFKACRSPSNA